MMRFASQPFLPVSSESNPAELSEPIINSCLDAGTWADRGTCAHIGYDPGTLTVITEQATHAF
jgi:hypothetical protein